MGGQADVKGGVGGTAPRVDLAAWPEQALTPERFQQLMRRLPAVLAAVERHLWQPEVPAQLVRAR